LQPYAIDSGTKIFFSEHPNEECCRHTCTKLDSCFASFLLPQFKQVFNEPKLYLAVCLSVCHQILLHLPYNRRLEEEADEVGLQLMAKVQSAHYIIHNCIIV